MTLQEYKTRQQYIKFMLRHYDSPILYCDKTKAQYEKQLVEIETHIFFLESFGE